VTGAALTAKTLRQCGWVADSCKHNNRAAAESQADAVRMEQRLQIRPDEGNHTTLYALQPPKQAAKQMPQAVTHTMCASFRTLLCLHRLCST
jgi:hypothetical protein